MDQDTPITRSDDNGHRYTVGVMTMQVEREHDPGVDRLDRVVQQATHRFDRALTQKLGVRVQLLTFVGPHLVPADGGYAPLDFLRMGMTEKLERNVHFLLIVTEVDLAATTFSYTLALPSQLTNVAVISIKRLRPGFWGRGPADPDPAVDPDDIVAQRLTALLLHSFGHLLNLPHHPDPDNVMYATAGVESLDRMHRLTDLQRDRMRRALPLEAHERTTAGGLRTRLAFTAATLWRDRGSISHAISRANPLRLLTRLPTMITAAASVMLLIFFSPEPWDVGSTVALWQLAIFSAVAVVGSTAVLYRTFSLGPVLGRGRVLAESSVVTAAAVTLSLLLTMALLFALFMGSTWIAAVTFFPRKLMETWPTVDPAVRALDHLKLAMFIAALGTLAGSLGGRADRKDLVRGVLFVDEET